MPPESENTSTVKPKKKAKAKAKAKQRARSQGANGGGGQGNGGQGAGGFIEAAPDGLPVKGPAAKDRRRDAGLNGREQGPSSETCRASSVSDDPEVIPDNPGAEGGTGEVDQQG